MIFRNMIFQLEVIKQRLPAGLVSHHEQASKANREQQHRVLWPAYNPNLATRQASTEGLFQQTRLIAEVTQRLGVSLLHCGAVRLLRTARQAFSFAVQP